MTSKELNEILNKTRRTKDICLSVEQAEELVKKLEALELFEDNIKFEEIGETQAGYMYRGYFKDVFEYKEKKLIEEVLK